MSKFNKFVENILAESNKDLYTEDMKNEHMLHIKEIVDAINSLSTYADCDFDEIIDTLKGKVFSEQEVNQIKTYLKKIALGFTS